MLASATPCFAAIALADVPRFIGEDFEEWEDTSGTASATEAFARGDFRRPSRIRPNHGFTRSAYFYRFTLENSTTSHRAFMLEAARAWVTDVDLFRVKGGIVELEARAGAHILRAKREVPCEEPTFAIELGPGESQTYLLRLAGNGPLAVRGEISPRPVFFEQHAHDLLLWGGLYGVLVGIAVYMAVIFAMLRDPQWRLAPMLLAGALAEAFAHGHHTRLLPFDIPDLEVRGVAFAVGAMSIAFGEWSRVVLGTRRAPRIDLVVRIGEVVGVSCCLVAGLVLRWHALRCAGPIIMSASTMIASVLRWRDGHAPARPFVIAVATLLIPGSVACATVLGYLPLNAVTEHGDYVGGALMAVLLALGASEEMRSARSKLEAKNREVTALADDLRDQVVQRSRELRAVLELHGRSADVSPLAMGTMFDERYRVLRPLGEGGMGAVYEVVRTRDERRLALKILTSATSSTAVLRLTREAEIGATLRHPNLVSIVDVGLRDGRVPFLVMDLVLGGSLENQRTRFGDVAWALGVLRGIAAGLRELHDAGVIHRDLKPSNVLMDNGTARICDFGIAKQSDHDIGATRTNAHVGTALYMAPETLAKAPPSPAADVFAFGLIAFELLTGEYPLALFAAASLGPSVAVPTPTLARVPGLTPRVSATLEACVAMNPASRPTASELSTLLSGSSSATATPAA